MLSGSTGARLSAGSVAVASPAAGSTVAGFWRVASAAPPRSVATTRNDVFGNPGAAFSELVRLCKRGGLLLGGFDRNVVDGGVNGAGWLTRFTATVSMWWDTWIIDGAVRFGSFFVKMLSYPVCILQTGRVQAYAFFVVIGALVFFGYYVVR